MEENYNPEDFFTAIKIKENPELADEGEKGERCRRCYEFRLKKAFDFARENHFEYFCTTLSISPFKDSVKINQIGFELENQFMENNGLEDGNLQKTDQKSPKWLVSDFKKKGGFKRSLEISEEYNLYRQTYCGCIYSFKNSQIH